MAEIERKVCSLEWSKKLKKAGYPQEGEYFWALCSDRASTVFNTLGTMHIMIISGKWSRDSQVENYVAPLACEILERLPEAINGEKLHLMKDDGYWTHQYFDNVKKELFRVVDIKQNNIANIIASMYIHLKEGGLI